ncbi:MAG: endopeptidase La [Chitinophagales bacterium]
MFDNWNAQPSLMDEDVEFLPIVSLEDEDNSTKDDEYAEIIPILPLRNTVLFSGVVLPVTVGREKSVKAIKKAYQGDKFIGVVSQLRPEIEDPNKEDLSKVGTIVKIVKLLKMPDGGMTVILHGRARFELGEITQEEPYLAANFKLLTSEAIPDKNEFQAIIGSLKDLATQIIDLSPNIPSEAGIILKNMDNVEFLIHFISSNLNVSTKAKQELLEIDSVLLRAEQVLEYLHKELQLLELKDQIRSRVKVDLDKQQRDYFLNQQLKTIQEELGKEGAGVEIKDLKKRAKGKKWSEAAKKTFEKELKKLQRLNSAMPDYSTTLNYLELLLELPWNTTSKDNFDLKRSQKVLDKDHYGLEKIKNRILEYLAVLKLKGDLKSPILCFVGPPGVGKTSLGKSIAKALNRKYIRMSFGGLQDESEIRGHRRTYIGAMPGRIIQSIKKAKTSNPVIVLDEVDKVASNFKGDPAAALLEVLDPEQNNSFYDNYLELEYDLSKVMFIATANSLQTLHPALRDRMEIIRLTAYSLEEKLQIAKKYLIPKQRAEHGLIAKNITLTQKIIKQIIAQHTHEAGVRGLERKIAAVMRAVAKSVALEEKYKTRISAADIDRILGPHIYEPEIYQDDNPAGVSIGLAWTQNGGEILFMETSLSKGKGRLMLTGNLGDVMKESAQTVLSYMKAHAEELKIEADMFEKTNFHLHVPEGAIPKDGPSAGIAILTALTSAMTKRKVKPFLAMTGEITLRGKVLPVGGIKEKVLAAKRAGIKEIILCEANKKNVDVIDAKYIEGVQFHYVKNMLGVVELALCE